MDNYRSFHELTRQEQEGKDFVVEVRQTLSPLAILAPHGGRIEPGTYTIADVIAGTDHSFYGFRGIKPRDNRMLHLTSSLFDDPRALEIVHSATTVITLHGCRGNEPMIFLGGQDQNLLLKVLHSLRNAGIPVQPASSGNLRGCHPENLCNRGRSGKGVQMEVSRGLRELLIVPLNSYSNRHLTPLFFTLVQAITTVVNNIPFATDVHG
jgi:phage replication-related protein YjqB (UPF0714/DUF867 family)